MEENNTSTDKNTLTALIDYENCGSLKNISLEQYGELIIFVGPQQNVVVLPADSFPEGARITIRQVSGVSRNNGKRLVRTVLIFTESSDQLSRATDRVPGLPASPGYVQ